jgi:signal peptidase II
MSADAEPVGSLTTGRGRGALAYALAFAVIVLDQASKWWLLNILHFGPGSSITLIGPLRLTFVYNQGISFGLFQGEGAGRWLLAAFSTAVAIALIVWARRATRLWLTVGIGLVIGGAVGNLIDRVLTGRVVDFVDVSAMMFPWVFNVADSAISIGVVVLILDQLFTPTPKPPAQSAP